MDLLLIRHARPVRIEGAGGPADPGLNDEGRRQAELLARWLEPEPLDAVYSSPLLRARQTAEPLVRGRPVTLSIADGVAEYDREVDSYIPLEELKAARDERWLAMASGDFTGLEGLEDPEAFRRTVVEAIEGIIAAHPGQTVAVVCHGGVINAWASHVLGLDRVLFFEPAYTSISRFAASRQGHRSVVSLNETPHLRRPPS